METRILLEKDQETIVRFEKERLEKSVSDPMEREMKTWDARWRKEALEHYLPQGWSFGVFENGKLAGYFLGQPYLFHRGLTQTLWIEHLAYDDIQAAEELAHTAYRWAKDKHLQAVLLENNPDTGYIVELYPKALVVGNLIELRSAKF